tara:strand:- start:174 stop:374 length:201 start_codon:yes stop_codon:yes gene_type:complete
MTNYKWTGPETINLDDPKVYERELKKIMDRLNISRESAIKELKLELEQTQASKKKNKKAIKAKRKV